MPTKARKAVLALLRARDRVARYPLCRHTSHRLHLFCWRWSIYDFYCVKHNNSCFDGCP